MKSKRLLILVIILIAVIALAGVLWYGNRPVNDQPEPKPNDNKTATTTEEVIDTEEDIDTSDWLTYRNEDIGYTLKYPSDWQVKEDETIQLGVLQNLMMIHCFNCEKYTSLIIQETERVTNYSDSSTTKLIDNIKIGGYQTYLAYKEDSLSVYYKYFLQLEDKKSSILIYFVPSKEVPKEIYFKIFETIEFDK